MWDSPGAGVTGDLEKIDVDAGNQTWVIWKSNTGSSLLSPLSRPLFEHFKLTCFVVGLICKYFLPFHKLPFYGTCYDVALSGLKLGVLSLWNYRSKPSQPFTFQFQECFISFLVIHLTPTHHKVSNSKLRKKERNSYHETFWLCPLQGNKSCKNYSWSPPFLAPSIASESAFFLFT